ncbi:hypothetical protein GW17_00052542 [Ensete ventricosum]|nr:hypothetical protein GW17_00052542 [Ensete ventricosum]RZS17857.1 hypothetical protein BHM03_00050056 [Ensete ventricosum]
MHVSDPDVPSSLDALRLEGNLSFHDVSLAAKDFGNRFRFLPSAVLHPVSVSDIAAVIKHVFQMGPSSKLTVAARGHGHSLQGQAQADGGVVIHMESLRGGGTRVHAGERPYVDASGGELWINVLLECLKHGLAPKSWTDYLHLTIGGTLSNAGISGQAFRHGPQISNVHQLQIVTGSREHATGLPSSSTITDLCMTLHRNVGCREGRAAYLLDRGECRPLPRCSRRPRPVRSHHQSQDRARTGAGDGRDSVGTSSGCSDRIQQR